MPQTTLATLRGLSPTISVGMLTSDLLNLGSEIKILEDAGVSVLHFDVMDGCFCPMMTVGPPIVKASKTSMLKDVHLMIDEPLEKLDAYIDAGADIISFAIENCADPLAALARLGEAENINDSSRGIVRGISINPDTPIDDIAHLMTELEMVVVLTVTPGLSGQSFNPETAERVKKIQELRSDVLICIDGGVKMNNIADIPAMGADLIVTGSAVFDGKDAAGNAKAMLAKIAER
jgi:ribulose-phosphate 3-epimerase